MRRIIGLAVLLVVALAGYRYYANVFAPERAYRKFAEHILWQRYDDAAKLADGLTADDLRKLGSQERIGAGPSMFQTLFPSQFKIESRSSASDGTLTFHAIQTVLFNPVGVESAIRPAMYAKLNQVVGLRKVGGMWKVTSFENEFATMDTTMKR